MSQRPHYGFTRHGVAVHEHTVDHLAPKAGDSAYRRFNKRVALVLVRNVGTMTCFWIFLLLSLTVLPAVLYAMGVASLKHLLPAFVLGFGFELLTTWLFSTCFQLVLLPGLMVGQNVQNEAADARAAKQFEDTEQLLSLTGEIHSLVAAAQVSTPASPGLPADQRVVPPAAARTSQVSVPQQLLDDIKNAPDRKPGGER